ncbi:hypothetical protein UN64_12715 [Fictibacillus arsenicus]|uniref:Uncharacterized protein n=1 Tax=Fictibacillus arsenicus TaxID=255247 RepID=A0A1V3G912_9BACL|nr:hypothetical protein UN64_12715 [Fictibacillus arsenicus]
MRAREDICALGEIYARSGRYMRAREDLGSIGKIIPLQKMTTKESEHKKSGPSFSYAIIKYSYYHNKDGARH